jgi:predicted DNA binding protein
MSVIAEFDISATEFLLGRVLTAEPAMHLELERIVPVSRQVMPYLWASGGDFEVFETEVRASPYVEELLALDRVGERVLYRVEWAEEVESLMYGIAETDATILEAYGNDGWFFRIRFVDHGGLTDFHNYCTDHDISFELRRVYTMADVGRDGLVFDLTDQQREALVLAVREGYYEVPRGTTLDELATEMGISEQAASERIRRAADRVLSAVLLDASAGDL